MMHHLKAIIINNEVSGGPKLLGQGITIESQ
jgi:hypothetical protein